MTMKNNYCGSQCELLSNNIWSATDCYHKLDFEPFNNNDSSCIISTENLSLDRQST